MPTRVNITLTDLHCIAEHDASGGSEPYLWVCFFGLDGRNIAQPDPMTVFSPAFDGFRTAMPNDVRPGRVMKVPSPISSFSLEMDPGPARFMLAGCAAVVFEEDETPHDAVVSGRIAFAKAMQRELNALVRERLRRLDTSSLREQEMEPIQAAVKKDVAKAVAAKLSPGQKLFADLDDTLGFSYFTTSGKVISRQDIAFPEVQTKDRRNRYRLFGNLTTADVTPPAPDRCADLRLAFETKDRELQGLRAQRVGLEARLQSATPQAKPALIAQIRDLAVRIELAEDELRVRRAALELCEKGVIGSA